MKKAIAFAALFFLMMLCSACEAAYGTSLGPHFLQEGNYRYEGITERGFSETDRESSCYFSLDRNTANYSQVRAQLLSGRRIAYDSVRIEELINYFSYDYPVPEEELGVSAYLTDCPWNEAHRLVAVGVRTRERRLEAERGNYVFLIDVSGSMAAAVEGLEGITCLDLVKTGIGTLAERLTAEDSVAIVTYARNVERTLPPTRMDENGKEKFRSAVGRLSAYGSTNGAGGLRLAYEVARESFLEGGNNRIVLLTDGDFNVGTNSREGLESLVREEARDGIYLSALGVGMGNMRDDLMESMAMNANGNYAYIDTPMEAEKLLSEELDGMLVPVAKDAKACVEFDAKYVKRYRLLGYDRKGLTQSEYVSEETDAGEIGSNLCVTALFEVELTEDASAGVPIAAAEVKYRSAEDGEDRAARTELFFETSESDELVFMSCVAEFGLVLRQSEYGGAAELGRILARLQTIRDYLLRNGYREEFSDLVQRAKESGYYD